MSHPTTEKEYYEDSDYISFSALKLFSKCPQLYKEVYLDKSIVQEDHDYFVYGKVVDALITETPEYFEEHFQIVSRSVNPLDKLRLEAKVTDLTKEMIERKEKADAGNKVAQKGILARSKEVVELTQRIAEIDAMGTKIQVTKSLYENAEATALAIKQHPFFERFFFKPEYCQKILATEKLFNKFKAKGRLDYLYLEGSGDIFVNGEQGKFTGAKIADVKTCRDLKSLDLNNSHYKGQLAFYRLLVSSIYNIPKENISCYIIVGDKQTSTLKHSEIFEYDSKLLDEMEPILEAWTQKVFDACTQKVFISARKQEGIKQECFTCSDCRVAPFSKDGSIVKIDQALLDSQKNNSYSPTLFATQEELTY